MSAFRDIHGVRYLQTDASLNPGNSGGPLLTQSGQAAAVVSWKISGGGIEGLAFGVPTTVALNRLGVTWTMPSIAASSASASTPRSTSPAGPPGAAHPTEGPRNVCTVARVIDGDTVECVEGEQVRLLLIDAPEMSQSDFGLKAKILLETILPTGSATTVELDVQERDRYGRVLAYLYTLDGAMVNEKMVRSGYAVVSVYPPNVRYVERIRSVQGAAVEARRGLWASWAFECLPAEHRAGRCE